MKFLSVLSLLFMPLFAEIRIYTSKDSAISNLSKKQIIKIYLKKTKSIDGHTIIVYDNVDDYEAFYKEIIGKSPSKIHAYWMKQVFLGKNTPPKKMTYSELLEQIENKNTIIYSHEDIDAKVIYVQD